MVTSGTRGVAVTFAIIKLRTVAAIVLVLSAMLSQQGHAAPALAQAPCLIRPLITAVQCEQAPVIDGKLTDAAWQRANGAPFAVPPGELGHRIQTCWDGQTLYLAIRCEEPHMATMIGAGEGSAEADTSSQESVEVFLSPDDGSNYYYHFVVTPANARTAEHGKVSGSNRDYQLWSGDWQSAVHSGPDYWQAEMAISLADLDKEPSTKKPWGMTVARNRRNGQGSYRTEYCWSQLIDDADLYTFNMHPVSIAEVVGLLRFAESGATTVERIGDLLPGTKQIVVKSWGLDNAEVVVRSGSKYWIEAMWRLGDVSDNQEVRARRRLKPNGTTDVWWSQRAVDEASSIEVRDRDSGDVIYASGQLYRRPITTELIWEEIACSEHPDTLKLQMEDTVSGIEASDAPYDQRLAAWEDARSQVRARLTARRSEQLMRNGPKESGQPAYGIGIASSMTKIRPKELTLGRLDYTSKISLQAARNEMGASQVVVYSPHKDLRDVKLTWSDLRGKSGASIGSKAIFAAPLGFVKTEQPVYSVYYIGWWSDPILTNLDSFDVVQNDLQPVWYSVRVPVGAPPGVYRGTLTISPANSASTVIPVELEVWNLTLPREASLDTSINCKTAHAYEHENPSPERIAALEDIVDRYLVDHRCNPGGLYRTTPPDEKTLARWAEIGVTAFNILDVRGFEREDIRRMTAETLALAEKYGIADRAYLYLPDEAGFDEFPAIEELAAWLKQQFPDVPLLTTEWLWSHMVKEARQGLPYGAITGRKTVDWICPTLDGWHNKHWGDYARVAGKKLWWYIATGPYDVPHVFIEDPGMDPRLLMGFLAYAFEPDGFLYHRVFGGQNNNKKLTGGPYVDWNAETWGGHNGGALLFYPGQDGPITSIRMENWLDGAEDYEYLTLAEKRVKQLRDAGRKDEADKLEAVLKPYCDPSNEVVWGLKDEAHTPDPRVVEAARRKIALAILEASGQ